MAGEPAIAAGFVPPIADHEAGEPIRLQQRTDLRDDGAICRQEAGLVHRAQVGRIVAANFQIGIRWT